MLGARPRACPHPVCATSVALLPVYLDQTAMDYYSLIVSLLAALIVGGFGLFLIGLSGVVFVRREIAERFVMSFASSARAHYSEQIVRLLVGGSLVVLSPSMWQPDVFRVIGWLIAVTSVGLMCIPWQWHHRIGMRVLPILVRYLKIYALLMLVFGGFLLYGVRGP